MAMPNSELEKIGSVLLDFFKTNKIQESFDIIHEAEIYGWEKWWQTELAIYLANADAIAEWDMEHRFNTDRRTDLVQTQMAVDIGFRLKSHTKNEWHFVELKQDNNYQRCIDNMCQDAKKVLSAHKRSSSGHQIRYLACAGIFHSVEDEEVVRDYSKNALAKINVDYDGHILKAITQHHSLLIF